MIPKNKKIDWDKVDKKLKEEQEEEKYIEFERFCIVNEYNELSSHKNKKKRKKL